jgi:4-hydroxy-3-polyprenylbenzoate decarboxylase
MHSWRRVVVGFIPGGSVRIIVGVTGASGVIYGVRLLERLRGVPEIETHLVATRSAELTLRLETQFDIAYLRSLATVAHNIRDVGATIASGSFPVDGMLIAPCSMKTLSGVVHSYSDNLLLRAADVTLKERRPLVLAVRETPLHLGHLRLMAAATEIGASIFPPVPAMYTRPTTVDDLIDHSVLRMLQQVGISLPDARVWEGTGGRDAT